jgi:hypothetical protein
MPGEKSLGSVLICDKARRSTLGGMSPMVLASLPMISPICRMPVELGAKGSGDTEDAAETGAAAQKQTARVRVKQ